MLLGSIKQLTYSIADTVILNKLSAELPKGTCIAIVGANGAGKSTLLSLLAEEIMPVSGSIDWIGKKPSITYFKQEQKDEESVNWDGAETAMYLSKWHVPEQAEYAFASGGERMKMRLAAALAENSELVLLDEPTNHLDRESLDELVDVINDGKATYIIVSHDRHFIDRTADFVFEIEHGKLEVYAGNYSVYHDKKEMDRETQAAHYEQQQRKIARVEGQISQLGEWSATAHANSTKKGGAKEYWRMKAKKKDVQIRSKRTRLEAELTKERIDKPDEDISVEFDLKGKRKKGHRVVELKNVHKAFDGKDLFENVSFTVQAGERIALIGSNGSGKSSLFKMMMGEEVYDGELWLTNGMTIGYMSQAVLDLPEDVTLAEYFHTETFEEQGIIRIQLTNLGFEEKHWKLRLGELSQGERVKVKLMQFIIEGTDVLLLDEPTNHLDLPSREEMEKTLATFPGTLLFASHDRFFTERMATGLLVFENRSIRKIPQTLQEWESRNEVSAQTASSLSEELMRVETELQAVLGKLSMVKPGDPSYAKLDLQFNALSRKIRDLK
ncbi:ABC-F family ATP-binding cassette domain-containing protein [Sporosarcina oncorhynchi]|uniref:ABC-F family ATP-binding cassette domain-containing protein n=1 Tax=Sporosarcina oncorhynchi TaxID=3056444 RepID=A0ABZ0L426_9BACL|nr:ABC-F family ATP-binding cassette domain-containing protein [Sporosarcina sp. T2O-4]WOV87351.1 ABC-F family ATP-binding cassette domain-containing protein [Sporosarcina sp. T2O-4]